MVILSTEENRVVYQRAKKIKVPVIHGVDSKRAVLEAWARKKGFSLQRVLYIGNDVNDVEAMSVCGFRVCPSDAYPQIKKIASLVLKSRGGEGVIRELVDDVLGIDMLNAMRGKKA